jgi:hypothetical protein
MIGQNLNDFVSELKDEIEQFCVERDSTVSSDKLRVISMKFSKQ